MEFEEKPPSNNKTFCCVPGCYSKAKRNRTLSFHLFPKQGKRKVLFQNKLGTSEKIDIHKAWALRLRIHLRPAFLKLPANRATLLFLSHTLCRYKEYYSLVTNSYGFLCNMFFKCLGK